MTITNKKMILGYTVGIIDGEGHINYTLKANGRGKKYPTAIIIVCQSEKNNGELLCGWLKEVYGGYVYRRL